MCTCVVRFRIACVRSHSERTMAVAPAEKGHSPFPSSERAVYGFALYLGSYVLIVLFLLWALLPDEWLLFIGFSYFPQKYWAVAMPAYLCVCLVLVVVLYAGINMTLVPTLDDPRTITDPLALAPPPDHAPKTLVPSLYDIPISTVNRRMFRKSPTR